MPTASRSTRIDEHSWESLRRLAEDRHESMQTILAAAIERYRREQFLASVNRAFSILRSDPAAWQQEREEREAWDQTIADGLEAE